jgi:hypothetical protein
MKNHHPGNVHGPQMLKMLKVYVNVEARCEEI